MWLLRINSLAKSHLFHRKNHLHCSANKKIYSNRSIEVISMFYLGSSSLLVQVFYIYLYCNFSDLQCKGRMYFYSNVFFLFLFLIKNNTDFGASWREKMFLKLIFRFSVHLYMLLGKIIILIATHSISLSCYYIVQCCFIIPPSHVCSRSNGIN